ncbi:MAG: type II toxin-antitoxin system VapC family toxin [Isosphaeraceae bacterium]
MVRPKPDRSLKNPPIGLVLDNSIAMSWSFEDEANDYADAVLNQLAATTAVVPVLWPLEVANALLMGERRNRSTEAETLKWIGLLSALPITIDEETNAHAWSESLNLARLPALRL